MVIDFQQLGTLAKVTQGRSIARLESKDGSPRQVIQAGNLAPTGFIGEFEVVIATDDVAKGAIAQRGFILMGQVTSNLRAVLVDDARDGNLVGANIAMLNVDSPRLLPEFLVGMLNTETVQRELRRRAGGALSRQVSLQELRNFRIPTPSIDDQRAFIAMFTAAVNTSQLVTDLLQAQSHVLEHAASHLWRRAEVGGLQ